MTTALKAREAMETVSLEFDVVLKHVATLLKADPAFGLDAYGTIKQQLEHRVWQVAQSAYRKGYEDGREWERRERSQNARSE